METQVREVDSGKERPEEDSKEVLPGLVGRVVAMEHRSRDGR